MFASEQLSRLPASGEVNSPTPAHYRQWSGIFQNWNRFWTWIAIRTGKSLKTCHRMIWNLSGLGGQGLIRASEYHVSNFPKT